MKELAPQERDSATQPAQMPCPSAIPRSLDEEAEQRAGTHSHAEAMAHHVHCRTRGHPGARLSLST